MKRSSFFNEKVKPTTNISVVPDVLSKHILLSGSRTIYNFRVKFPDQIFLASFTGAILYAKKAVVMSPGYFMFYALAAFQKSPNLDQQARRHTFLFPLCTLPKRKGPDLFQEKALPVIQEAGLQEYFLIINTLKKTHKHTGNFNRFPSLL